MRLLLHHRRQIGEEIGIPESTCRGRAHLLVAFQKRLGASRATREYRVGLLRAYWSRSKVKYSTSSTTLQLVPTGAELTEPVPVLHTTGSNLASNGVFKFPWKIEIPSEMERPGPLTLLARARNCNTLCHCDHPWS